MNKLYTLVDYGWGHTNTYILEGPEQTDWKKFCDSLLDKAAVQTVRQQAQEPYLGHIRLHRVVNQLLGLLIEQGYKEVSLDSADYFTDGGYASTDDDALDYHESPILLSPLVLQIVEEFNEKVGKLNDILQTMEDRS